MNPGLFLLCGMLLVGGFALVSSLSLLRTPKKDKYAFDQRHQLHLYFKVRCGDAVVKHAWISVSTVQSPDVIFEHCLSELKATSCVDRVNLIKINHPKKLDPSTLLHEASYWIELTGDSELMRYELTLLSNMLSSSYKHTRSRYNDMESFPKPVKF